MSYMQVLRVSAYSRFAARLSSLFDVSCSETFDCAKLLLDAYISAVVSGAEAKYCSVRVTVLLLALREEVCQDRQAMSLIPRQPDLPLGKAIRR